MATVSLPDVFRRARALATVAVLTVALSAAAGTVTTAVADGLYLCKGEDGRKRYLSEPKGECERNPSAAQKPSASASSGSSSSSGAKQSRSISVPRVAGKRRRDDKRGEILLYELRQEKLLHRHFLRALEQAPASDERGRKRLLRQTKRHKLNIAALRYELARLGVDAGDTGD